MPDTTLSQAIKEAYAAAPTSDVTLHTIEMTHASFSTPLRFVRDVADCNAMLEATAPVNPSTVVTFTGMAFDLRLPDVRTDGLPTMQLVMDNTGREIMTQFELAAASTSPIAVRYRAYLASALGAGPQNSPILTMEVQGVTITITRITLECGFLDLLNRRFPTVEYSADVYAGLIP